MDFTKAQLQCNETVREINKTKTGIAKRYSAASLQPYTEQPG